MLCQQAGAWPFPNLPGEMTFAQALYLAEALRQLNEPKLKGAAREKPARLSKEEMQEMVARGNK